MKGASLRPDGDFKVEPNSASSVIGGGYDSQIDRLAHRHATLRRSAADAWRSGLAHPGG